MKPPELKDGQHIIRVGEPEEITFTVTDGVVTDCSNPAYKGQSTAAMLETMASCPAPRTHLFKPLRTRAKVNPDGCES
jgi:hypothetical protein